MRLFDDRAHAGRELAAALESYRARKPVIIGLTRGGVPLAYEVARMLDAPLDVCVVRKIGAPVDPELGVGAVAEDGAIHLDREMLQGVGVSDTELVKLVAAKRAEVEERVRRFRRGAPPIDVRRRTVIVVDDGVATGGTAFAAAQTMRIRGAGHLVLAVPVAPASVLDDMASFFDDVVCLHPEHSFFSVGQWYRDFEPTTDDDVAALLARADANRARRDGAAEPAAAHGR